MKASKNFNLLVSLSESDSYLVKQERFDNKDESYGEFESEWRIQGFLDRFPELKQLRTLVLEGLEFIKLYPTILIIITDMIPLCLE